MKAKKAKIILQPLDDIKKEWTLALKGKVRSMQKNDEIIVTSLETIAKIFSKTRMEILHVIIIKKPRSIYELAKIVDRNFKKVVSEIRCPGLIHT